MSVWIIILIFAVLKIPLAALMLWIPFRNDSAADDDADAGERDDGDDGGTKTPPTPPRHPHPRGPLRQRRRGRHGAPSSPARVRIGIGRRLRRPRRVPAR